MSSQDRSSRPAATVIFFPQSCLKFVSLPADFGHPGWLNWLKVLRLQLPEEANSIIRADCDTELKVPSWQRQNGGDDQTRNAGSCLLAISQLGIPVCGFRVCPLSGGDGCSDVFIGTSLTLVVGEISPLHSSTGRDVHNTEAVQKRAWRRSMAISSKPTSG
jgi:hypothetical protein